MADLLTLDDLPTGFAYPAGFIRVVELGLTNLEPWWILTGDALRERYSGLAQRYPQRTLVPFARRQDNDDVACWDLADGPATKEVVVVHDFAGPGFEARENYGDFYDWFRQAVEDLISFDL
jgi:hypothetical protein